MRRLIVALAAVWITGSPRAEAEGAAPPARTEGAPPPARAEGAPPPVRTEGAPPPARAEGARPPVRTEAPAPPARPELGEFETCARALFDAVVHDDPVRASACFFPRDAFLQVKAMKDPGRYFDRLRARFERDIHALHQNLGDLSRARYERFELARRGGWVGVGEEGNRLPYWASRHSFLYYRAGNELKRFEVRVLITWQERWYVIHLSEFH